MTKMAHLAQIYNLDNPNFKTYCFYYTLLILKMLLMSSLTGLLRFWNMSFISPEDSKFFNINQKVSEDVERVRRAHMNDLENIPIFIMISLLYLMTNPSEYFAKLLIKGFTLSRFIHTFVYAIIVIPQPARMITWCIGYGITLLMGYNTLRYFM